MRYEKRMDKLVPNVSYQTLEDQRGPRLLRLPCSWTIRLEQVVSIATAGILRVPHYSWKLWTQTKGACVCRTLFLCRNMCSTTCLPMCCLDDWCCFLAPCLFPRCWQVLGSGLPRHVHRHLQRADEQTCGHLQRGLQLHHPHRLGHARWDATLSNWKIATSWKKKKRLLAKSLIEWKPVHF